MPVQGYTVYIKIARIDKNGIDQTNTLQSLNQVTVPYSTGNITYEVIGITEHPTYYLYYVKPAQVGWADRAEIEYDFTGSILNSSTTYQTTQDMTGAPDLYIKFPITSSLNDNLNFLNRDSSTNFDNNNPLNTYQFSTYPQETIQINFSGSIMFEPYLVGAGVSAEVALVLLKKDEIEPTLLQFTPYSIPSSKQGFTLNSTNPITSSFHISASLTSSLNPGDSLFAALGTFQVSSNSKVTASFTTDTIFTISSPPSTGLQVGLVPEPYFGENNFLRALDCQPLLNNAVTPRIHNIYQDVDYSAGATEPVNFDLLISGSATRAEVQISNYTTRRHVIPRYEGSKSTSQKLNTWTKGDTGTFGKTPTVESLKTVIAYCDWLGGWPPERMNASTAHVLYLIDADGNISVPNTSENSLPNIQGAFQTGERFRISTKTIGSGPAETFRNVIRGGQRIEPILYTQSGSAPSAQWNTTMSFEDIIPSIDGAVGNYISTNTPTELSYPNNIWTTVPFGYTITGTLINASGKYTIPSGVINDGVNLRPQFKVNFKWKIKSSNNINSTVTFRIVKETSGGDKQYYGEISQVLTPAPNDPFQFSSLNLPSEIPLQELNQGDKIYIEALKSFTPDAQLTTLTNSYFKVTQYPLPTSPITSSGYNSIWNWGDSNTYPNVITSSNPTLIDLLNECAKQTDIIGSGFNPISLPWSIEYGDEFRFEGREDFTYMVSKIFSPYESGSRVFPTGSIEVHFNSNLPTGSDTSAFNLDHFLIRRYVDDPSQIIFEGFKPTNSQGPYILTPEYSTAKLNTNIDDVISSLKERGLVTGEEGS